MGTGASGKPRQPTARQPQTAPVRPQANQGRDQKRRKRDTHPNAAEVERRQSRPPRQRQALQDQGGGEDQYEGTREAPEKAQQQKGRKGITQGHGRRRRRARTQSCQEPGAAAARQLSLGCGEGTQEIAKEIGRGDKSGLVLCQTEALLHHRQYRGIDKAANAHCRSKCRNTGKGQD